MLKQTKSAIDFAYATVADADGLALNKKANAQFESEAAANNWPESDYANWTQNFLRYRQLFVALKQNDELNAARAAQAAAPAPAK